MPAACADWNRVFCALMPQPFHDGPVKAAALLDTAALQYAVFGITSSGAR